MPNNQLPEKLMELAELCEALAEAMLRADKRDNHPTLSIIDCVMHSLPTETSVVVALHVEALAKQIDLALCEFEGIHEGRTTRARLSTPHCGPESCEVRP
jgi:hypothetical protein